MLNIFYFMLFVILVILSGPLLAYPLYVVLHSFTDIEFHKLIGNTTLVCGLIFSFVYLKLNQIAYKTGFGFSLPAKPFIKQLTAGIGAGIIILLFLVITLLILGIHQAESELNLSAFDFLKIVITAILAGCMVGLLEESIFRGALFSGLNKNINVIATIFLTSLIYAAVHFLKYRALADSMEINWYTGLEMIPAALFRFQDPAIIDTFLTLFSLGVLLALIRIRNGNIAQAIGVHAGIVMMLKISSDFTDYNPPTRFPFLVNDYNHTMGYLAFMWLSILCVIYYYFWIKD